MKILLISFFLALTFYSEAQDNNLPVHGENMLTYNRPIQKKNKQVVDSAQWEVQYDYLMLGDRLRRKITDKMILLIGAEYTYYYSYMNFVTDSLRNVDPEKWRRPTTMQVLQDSIYHGVKNDDLPYNIFNRGRYLIHRNLGKLLCVDADIYVTKFSLEYDYAYEEVLEKASWKISEEKDTIIGLCCQKASTQYCGRDWIVWFAPDVPLQEGPWKLRGLPGLILKAETADGEFSLIATSLATFTKRPIEKYAKDAYEYITKKDMFTIFQEISKNPFPRTWYGSSWGKAVQFTAEINFIEL